MKGVDVRTNRNQQRAGRDGNVSKDLNKVMNTNS